MSAPTTTPTILYKYLGPRGVRVLTSRSLRFTPPVELNDPFESRLPEVIRLAGRASESSQPVVFPEDEQRLLKAIGNTYAISCFSQIPDDLLMWAHYGQAHSGIVIGFRTEHPAFTALGRLFPVSYRTTRPLVSSQTPEESILRILTTKSRHWRYEREWRVLTRLPDCTRTGALFLKPLDPECIEGVILGVRANQAMRRQVATWKAEHPGARVLQARLDSLRFGLYFDESLHPNPAVVVAGRRHVPVGFNLPFASVLEMRDGTLLVRDITSKIIPEKRLRRSVASQAQATGAQIIIHGQLPNKRLQRPAAKRGGKSAGRGRGGGR